MVIPKKNCYLCNIDDNIGCKVCRDKDIEIRDCLECKMGYIRYLKDNIGKCARCPEMCEQCTYNE